MRIRGPHQGRICGRKDGERARGVLTGPTGYQESQENRGSQTRSRGEMLEQDSQVNVGPFQPGVFPTEASSWRKEGKDVLTTTMVTLVNAPCAGSRHTLQL